MAGESTTLGEQVPSGSEPGAQVGRSGRVAYVEKRPVRVLSMSTWARDFSRTTRRPRASLVATCTPCSEERSWRGTVQDRCSVPPRVHSKTRDGIVSPVGLLYVPA